MRLRYFLMVCLLWAGNSNAYADTPLGGTPDIVYFGNNAYPPQYDEIFAQHKLTFLHVNLDAQYNLEAQLSKNLPQDETAAKQIVDERFQRIPAKQVSQLFYGPILAQQWHINRFPAYVFEGGKAVVYGITNAREAVQRWSRWRKRHK